MEKGMIKIAFAGLFILSILFALPAQAQTAGTFTFSINPVVHTGSYGAKHVVAVWLENATGTFIKTKLRYSSNSTIDHLATWTSKSASNVVDATTGATLTSYAPLTAVWNGTNVSNAVVADGDYKIWIEMAWDDSKTTAKTVTSFDFTKGPTAVHLTPANTSLFTGIALDWVPTVSGVQDISQSKMVNVFPNPTNGKVNIDFKAIPRDCNIQVVNSVGSIVYTSHVIKGTTGIKTLDLRKFAKGVYSVNILYSNKAEDLHYKILLGQD